MKINSFIKKILFIAVLLLTLVHFSNNVNAETVITVGPTGTYKTISEAVAVALPGTTVYVQNGVYNESVKVYLNISIVGESRDGVVLQYPCTYYQFPPLEAHCGVFKNLTIKALPAAAGVAGVRSYAVHCEKAYSLAGLAIHFENCRFESVGNWDVGMGSCNGFTATFNNCMFDNMGMFYHTYGTNLGVPICSVLNLNNCTFAETSSFSIRNCFANNSILKVNAGGTKFPTMGLMAVMSCSDAVGGPIVDNNFKFGAKNVIWTE